jgi:hypothetical protein
VKEGNEQIAPPWLLDGGQAVEKGDTNPLKAPLLHRKALALKCRFGCNSRDVKNRLDGTWHRSVLEVIISQVRDVKPAAARSLEGSESIHPNPKRQ